MSVVTDPAAKTTPGPAEDRPADLLRAALQEARELTAVERFAKAHDADAPPAQSRYYRDLIPVGPPGQGEQYAFDVDLDKCSGCKACVSACHHLNGLETGETWRWVGQLYGGSSDAGALPIIQHVTTACHHCVDPGCLNGCPTNAYEKDPVTGVVRHLDDQCFGCQYCTMACPYEVPQYSASKGIVRKCDMCHGRLEAGEAPACVQACPNQAIRITTVSKQETVARTGRGLFLPDTPPAHLTKPATVYRTKRGLPIDSAGADFGHAEPQHAHAPLVVMLVLTQMSVGLVAVAAFARWLGGGAWTDAATVAGMLAGQAGLAVAPLHLGRPHLAFRAVLGWRHSWLSREAAVFGAYAALSVLAAVLAALPHVSQWLPDWVTPWTQRFASPFFRTPAEAAAIVSGLAGVYCSAKIYLFTGRAFWLGNRTFAKFGGTVAVLGGAGAAAASALLSHPATTPLALMAALAAAAKLGFEASLFTQPTAGRNDLALTAKLQRGPLRRVTTARFALGAGGLLLAIAAAVGLAPIATAPMALAALLAGELAERWLYFSTVVPLRMPGGAPTR